MCPEPKNQCGYHHQKGMNSRLIAEVRRLKEEVYHQPPYDNIEKRKNYCYYWKHKTVISNNSTIDSAERTEL